MVATLKRYSFVHTDLFPLPNIHKVPSNRMGTDQMHPSSLALSTLYNPTHATQTLPHRLNAVRISL